MNVNKIKAGTYQLLAERWDEQTSKPGEPFTFVRHSRGDEVRLSEADARRLVSAGAAVEPGSIERAQAAAAAKHLQAMLAQVPDEVRAELLAQFGPPQDDSEDAGDDSGDDGGTGNDPGGSQPPPGGTTAGRPDDSDSKGTWVAYAVEQGMVEAEAQKLSRNALAARYPAAPPPA